MAKLTEQIARLIENNSDQMGRVNNLDAIVDGFEQLLNECRMNSTRETLLPIKQLVWAPIEESKESIDEIQGKAYTELDKLRADIQLLRGLSKHWYLRCESVYNYVIQQLQSLDSEVKLEEKGL
jgi:hypothetical protein